jgi:tetratricopeptide (TPR) repeat protein
VNHPVTRSSLLIKLYHRYLSDGDTAHFIAGIAQRFMPSTLERLLQSGNIQSRRAAALAIGLLGQQCHVELLGPLLRSADRRLRLIADDALRALAAREGTLDMRQSLEQIVRCNECANFAKTIILATTAISEFGVSAEFLHQRSLAYFQTDMVQPAINDCLQVLKLNRYHYAAMVGLGHCYMETGDLIKSLYWFRQALDVYPDLEPIRVQVSRLEKAIQGS